MIRALATALVVAISFALSGVARADEPVDDATLFRTAVTQLQQGRPGQAIDNFEALADHGVVDATVSYDRGLAYANRIRVGGEQAGDLGQAAHGFLEASRLASTRQLRREAESALGMVRTEVGRRRAAGGEAGDVDPGIPLGPSILRLLREDTWALLGALGSLVLGGALIARRLSGERRSRIAATVTGAVATLVLVFGASAAFAARSDRLTATLGVIVSAGARPANDKGIVLPNVRSIPEAAEVQVLEHRGGWLRVRWGTQEAWIPATSVRALSELAR